MSRFPNGVIDYSISLMSRTPNELPLSDSKQLEFLNGIYVSDSL